MVNRKIAPGTFICFPLDCSAWVPIHSPVRESSMQLLIDQNEWCIQGVNSTILGMIKLLNCSLVMKIEHEIK